MVRVLAVDMGASSVRVVAVDLDARPLKLEVVHRYFHGPRPDASGALRWDWDRLVAEVQRGLGMALDAGPAASIGVAGWGLDYGLLDEAGSLVAQPYCYRDERTRDWRSVAERLGPERLYGITGIQLIPVNTIFQLAAHDRTELERAHRLLMLPNLMVHALTGVVTTERSIASTTGLLDVETGEWSGELIRDLQLDGDLFPPITPAPAEVGEWRGVPVHLVGCHDTASAFLALPGRPEPRAAIASSGTWMLVGAELPDPVTSAQALAANFANEAGALGGVRLLKNVTGTWMLEQCRQVWGDPPLDELLAAAERVPPGGPTVDALDERFVAPPDMVDEVRAAAGLPSDAGRDVVVRTVLDSLAATTARVVGELEPFVGGPVSELHIVGGGSRIALLNRLTEEACGVPVRVGSSEATALGNAGVQGIALGRFAGADEIRDALALGAAAQRQGEVGR